MTAPLRHSAFVKRDPHSRSLLVALAIDQRNSLICDMRDTFYPNVVSGREAARLIHLALSRFEGGPWQRLRAEVECPARYRGKIEFACFVILRAAGRTPSEIRIRQILADRPTRYPPPSPDCADPI